MGNSMVSIGLGAGGVSLFAFSMIAGTGGLMLLDVAFVPRGWPARVGRLVLAAVALTLAVVALYEARVLLQRAGFVA